MHEKPPRRKRRLLSTGAVLAITALSLAACSSGGSTNSSASSDSITVLTPLIATQLSFDAGFDGSIDNFEMVDNINASLIRKPYVATNQNGVVTQDLFNFEGVLATGYDVSADGLTYTFHLRHGVMSEHGNELDADDVIWSYERKFGAATGITKYVTAPAITDPDKQFTKVDKYTVAVTVEKQSYGFTLLGTMADITGNIYDSDYLKTKATPADPWAVDWSKGKYDFGYGAYRIESATPGSEMVMVANPNYALGEPKIKRIVRRQIADAGVRATTLTSGDADIALGLKPSDVSTMAKDPNLLVPDIDANNWLILTPITSAAPFTDQKVREALAYATDYDAIEKNAYSGRFVKQNNFLPSGSANYVGTNVPNWSYDPAKAKALLAEAGITTPVKFTLTISNDDPAVVDAATQIASFASDGGFDITVDKLSASAYAAKLTGDNLQATLATGGAVTLSPAYELSLYTAPGSSGNQADYNSPAFQQDLADGIAAGDSLSPEAEKFWNAAEVQWLTTDVATIFVGKMKPTTALSSSLTGWTDRTDVRIDYSELSVK